MRFAVRKALLARGLQSGAPLQKRLAGQRLTLTVDEEIKDDEALPASPPRVFFMRLARRVDSLQKGRQMRTPRQSG